MEQEERAMPTISNVKMDVVVVNKDGRRNYFRCVPAEKLVKVQIDVSQGSGFVLSDDNELIAYAPGSVARVGLTESKESREPK